MNCLPHISDDEERLEDLIELWHTGDSELPLYEFLRLTWKEYADYLENRLTPEDVMARYDARS
jgi:hypothetical protein